MRAMRWLGGIFLIGASPAHAATLTATRPGVMCTQAAALGKLTRPDGSSRSSGADARPADLALKASGGCIDIAPGASVEVITARKNTSIVSYDAHDGQGARQFYVPNIDFAPAGQSSAGLPPRHVPAWPDPDYPPLADANRLFAAVGRSCPRQGWTEHKLSHAETGPWDSVEEKLTPAQTAAIQSEVRAQCDMGLSCPADITFGMEVRYGHLGSLVRAICSQKAPADVEQ